LDEKDIKNALSEIKELNSKRVINMIKDLTGSVVMEDMFECSE